MPESNNQLKQISYVLVMDKDRDKCITVMLEAIGMMPQFAYLFEQKLVLQKLEKVFSDFIEEINRKGHFLGWCEDPNCKSNKHP